MCEGVSVCTVRVCTVGHISNFEEHSVRVFESLYGCNSKHFHSYTLLLRILYVIYSCLKEHINAWSSLPFLSSDTVLSASKFLNLSTSTTLQHPSNISSVSVVGLETQDCSFSFLWLFYWCALVVSLLSLNVFCLFLSCGGFYISFECNFRAKKVTMLVPKVFFIPSLQKGE